MIDPEKVNEVFLDCLFKDAEITAGQTPDNAVLVEGITAKVGFHRERLEGNRETVKQWLSLLPAEFRKDSGGGWTFLNACNEADGTQWTGLHQRMDQLFMLGIGLGMAHWLLPRDMWAILPGGLPYVQIDVA